MPLRLLYALPPLLTVACGEKSNFRGDLGAEVSHYFVVGTNLMCVPLDSIEAQVPAGHERPTRVCLQQRADSMFRVETSADNEALSFTVGVGAPSAAARDSVFAFHRDSLTRSMGAPQPCAPSSDEGIRESLFWNTASGHVRLTRSDPTIVSITRGVGTGFCR